MIFLALKDIIVLMEQPKLLVLKDFINPNMEQLNLLIAFKCLRVSMQTRMGLPITLIMFALEGSIVLLKVQTPKQMNVPSKHLDSTREEKKLEIVVVAHLVTSALLQLRRFISVQVDIIALKILKFQFHAQLEPMVQVKA